jgi:hypothetical protein
MRAFLLPCLASISLETAAQIPCHTAQPTCHFAIDIKHFKYLCGKLRQTFEPLTVDYNTRPPGGGLTGLGELDVIGFDFVEKRVFLCEVTTHLDGMQIGPSAQSTVDKLRSKHERQKVHAKNHLAEFTPRFMLWSPVVRRGLLAELKTIGFELFVNEQYTNAISELKRHANRSTADANNPAYRVLQILEHLR